MSSSRLKRLQASLRRPLLIKKPENLLYLTGSFFSDPAYLVIEPERIVLFGGILEKVRGIKVKDTLSNIGTYVPAGSVLDVEDHLTVGEQRLIKQKIKSVKFQAGIHPVEQMRLTKERYEIEAVRRSMQICEKVLVRIKRALKKKTWTEIELARFIRLEGLKLGADGVSFDPIVAAGPNAAIPHHKPGDAALKTGQSIVLDFGFKVDGYCSDFTRTVFIRNAPSRLAYIYEQVEMAFRAALTAAKDGMPAKDVDAVARNYLKSKKLDKYFIHGLGHGTGLEVHEAPRLSPLSQETLRNGMVFSIEPGVYIPRLGGVRIEDLVYLDKGPAKRFIKASTSLKDNIIK